MKIGDEVFVHGYVDEIRKDVIIIRNNGGYFGTIEGEIVTADTPQTDKDKVVCPNCGRSDYIRSFEKDFNIKNSEYRYKCINCNTYIKDTPQTDLLVKTPRKSRDSHEIVGKHADQMIIDEMLAIKKIIDDGKMPQTETHDIRTNTHECVSDTPQTDCPWK